MTEEEEKEKINKLVDKLLEDLESNLAKEDNASIILLKGHLLIEDYLTDLLVIKGGKETAHKLSFAQKTQSIDEGKFLSAHVVDALRELNSIRNNLAHRIEFTITSSDIDQVGRNFGKTYALKKYEYTEKSTGKSKILRWLIEQIAQEIFVKIILSVMNEDKIDTPRAAPNKANINPSEIQNNPPSESQRGT